MPLRTPLPALPGTSRPAAPRVLQEQALRYFMEVVRSGSVTAAAERLNVAPSAVSRQIARLEQELDCLLFERRARGMALNAAGELLAAHARRSTQEIERVTQDIQALRGLQSGLVRLAATEGFASLLPVQIARFRERFPHIRFSLELPPRGEVPRLVREGEADIGVTLSSVSERGIQVELRLPAPIMAVVPPGHELARHRQLTLAQLAGYPLALPGPETTLRQLFDIACSRQGLAPEPALLSRTLEGLLAFAAAGGGVTLCGETALRPYVEDGSLIAIALRDREMTERHFEVQTLAGRTLPPACRAFLDHLQRGLQPAA
ncbi:LysR family transcriptional regulator [Xylophilus rhododendri]|uniref:LysR family transcriptional regulator n=1 Tax=Xylophilus rhododendri TaxID=2697032 RepID=A0A857J9P1_9BURK|nr:LysR family transcriptional regulator [Xylophilus rhododendri]QHI99712.1 LysR family transcriptional regulator [Xylophilus rhododendri]